MALSKSASSPRAAADLIVRATSAPNTFIFSELYQTQQIQALASSEEFSSHLALLQVFCYGTYESYHATPGLPAINDAQRLKLRQLSLLSLASDRTKLTYAALQKCLDLPSSREVEELVITAIYAELLEATLDPAREAVQVTKVAPLRDLAPGSIPGMIAALRNWSSRCTSTIEDLEAHATELRSTAAARLQEQRTADEKLKRQMAAMKDLDKLGPTSGRGAGKRSIFQRGSSGGQDIAMDVDGSTSARGSKRKI